MKNLTDGSIPRHVLQMAAPIAAGMVFQTLYYLVDLYFVGQQGDVATAGVSAAGNAAFLVFSLCQMLGVGTVAVVAHAVGRKDQADARLVFNQASVLAVACGAVVAVGLAAFTRPYLTSIASDPAVVDAGCTYLYAFAPGLALQFAQVAMGSALRGSGVTRPTMVLQVVAVLVNVVLAPVLIAGWGTGRPLGVMGAGLASTFAVLAGVAGLVVYFFKLEQYLAVDFALWRPRADVWKRILVIGLPSGGEFALMFVFTAVIYWTLRDAGAAAQAGYGIGSRVMQAIFLPALAVAFAASPVAGQNFGAGRPDRVRATFRSAALMCGAGMAVMTALCHWRAEAFIRFFNPEPAVVAVGTVFLTTLSWNFVSQGIIFTCSSLFQSLGNTVPSLLSSATRLVTFVGPAIWLSRREGFQLRHIWWLSLATVTIQVLTSVLLLQRELRRKLGPVRVDAPVGDTVAAG